MGVQVHKGRQDGETARIQDGFVGAGQGRKPLAHRLDRSPAEVELGLFPAGVDCVLDEHGVSSFGQPRRGRVPGRGQKKTFPQKGKVQLSETGNKPAAKKPAAKHIFSFSSAWAHSMAQFPFLICLAGILS